MAQHARAFAGNPSSVLNLPCGTGRFWSMLAQNPKRELLEADYSKAVLQVARTTREPCVMQRFRWPQCSASEITLPDDSVDGVFSIRLMLHISESTSRVAMPRDFYRVRQDSAVLSPWVSGSLRRLGTVTDGKMQADNEERKATTVSLCRARSSKRNAASTASRPVDTSTSCRAFSCGTRMCCARNRFRRRLVTPPPGYR